jgi:hypothetical protein
MTVFRPTRTEEDSQHLRATCNGLPETEEQRIIQHDL